MGEGLRFGELCELLTPFGSPSQAMPYFSGGDILAAGAGEPGLLNLGCSKVDALRSSRSSR